MNTTLRNLRKASPRMNKRIEFSTPFAAHKNWCGIWQKAVAVECDDKNKTTMLYDAEGDCIATNVYDNHAEGYEEWRYQDAVAHWEKWAKD